MSVTLIGAANMAGLTGAELLSKTQKILLKKVLRLVRAFARAFKRAIEPYGITVNLVEFCLVYLNSEMTKRQGRLISGRNRPLDVAQAQTARVLADIARAPVPRLSDAATSKEATA